MTNLKAFTIGHSSHSIDDFLRLLTDNEVTAVADVRSAPFSRYAPHFNKRPLEAALSKQNISYVFLGKELGGRSNDDDCYVEGQIQYSLLALTSSFHHGLGRLIDGSQRELIAVMCSEGDPLECHRAVLVGRLLEQEGVHVDHILPDGGVESQSEAMERLMAKFGLLQTDLFRSREDLEADALRRQERLIAFKRSDDQVPEDANP